MSDQLDEQTNLGQATSGDITPAQTSPTGGSQQRPDGLIQKVEGVVEQAVEGAIQKATDVVDGAIDTVADAAKRALGGDTSSNPKTPAE